MALEAFQKHLSIRILINILIIFQIKVGYEGNSTVQRQITRNKI